MVGSQPLRLRGRGFRAEELVKLRVRAGRGQERRVVRASESGAFVVAFARLRLARCGSALSVQADGSDGSRAAIDMQQLDCQPVDVATK